MTHLHDLWIKENVTTYQPNVCHAELVSCHAELVSASINILTK